MDIMSNIYLKMEEAQGLLTQFFDTLHDKCDNDLLYRAGEKFLNLDETQKALRCFGLYVNMINTNSEQVYQSYINTAQLLKTDIEIPINKAISLFPDRPDAYYILGKHYNDIRDNEKAYHLLYKCINLKNPIQKPSGVDSDGKFGGKYAYNEFSVACYWTGRYKEGMMYLKQIHHDPDFQSIKSLLDANMIYFNEKLESYRESKNENEDNHNVKYIPLGLQCSVPHGIDLAGHRFGSYPFDWLWTPSKTTYNILKILLHDNSNQNDNLARCVDYMTTGFTYYQYMNNEHYLSLPSNVVNGNQINKETGLGNTHFMINDEYKVMLKRRLERLLLDITGSNKIILIYADAANPYLNYHLDEVEYGTDPNEYLEKIYDLIYPINNDVTILYFCWKERSLGKKGITYIGFDHVNTWFRVSDLIRDYLLANPF